MLLFVVSGRIDDSVTAKLAVQGGFMNAEGFRGSSAIVVICLQGASDSGNFRATEGGFRNIAHIAIHDWSKLSGKMVRKDCTAWTYYKRMFDRVL
jgi:hypothetical protein